MTRWSGPSAALLLAAAVAGAQAQGLPPEIPDEPAPADTGTGSAAAPGRSSVVGRVELDELAESPRYADHLDTQRLVGDLRTETRLAGAATLRFSDRLELQARTVDDQQRALNILRELYVSTPLPVAGCAADLGRVNWKLGNALWYTPLDYFKRDAAVSSAAMTPASIRENRLGTLMLRGQCGLGAGVVQAAFVPQVERRGSFDRAAFAPGFERTNPRSALMLRASRTLSESSTVEASALHRDGEGTTVGVGLSQLFGDAVVMGLDIANAPALPDADGRVRERRATRVALSLAWTLPFGPTLTFEKFHAQDAYSAGGWNQLRGDGHAAPPADLIAYVQDRSSMQELATRNAYFAMANWLRAFDDPNFEALAAVGWNPVDHSRYLEAGATWHAGTSLSLQLLLERNQGAANTQYGLSRIKNAATLSLMLHF